MRELIFFDLRRWGCPSNALSSSLGLEESSVTGFGSNIQGTRIRVRKLCSNNLKNIPIFVAGSRGRAKFWAVGFESRSKGPGVVLWNEGAGFDVQGLGFTIQATGSKYQDLRVWV